MIKGKLFESSSGKANKPKNEQNYMKIPWHQCQCSNSSQIPSQDDLNYHQFLSLHKILWRKDRTELIIYDTENKKEEAKILDTEIILDENTSITQLPNGELFCYGRRYSGTTVIIDRNYGVRILPSGTPCHNPSVVYFNNNIYCFGGINRIDIALSRKFDLRKNRWINLIELSESDWIYHSVIFNGNILISGYLHKNLWFYSIEINSFSIIPYDFKPSTRKLMINVERLYIIEWGHDGLIYESEDEYNWKPISKSRQACGPGQMYCLYNKEKIIISTRDHYYQFYLKTKVIYQIK